MSEDYRFSTPIILSAVYLLSKGKKNRRKQNRTLHPPPHDRYIGLTGKIDCILEPKPLSLYLIPSLSEKCSDHKSYRFLN